ncbi:MAG: nicotinate-nucleotide adenylyltransferase [Bacteroidales bacterium]|nr:nicotinate-nucleotide adenylyltransferase [Bacteroidales bacterium]
MKNKEKIGLYFGSFNPIHYGHLIIANHIVQNTDIDKVWFVVSPQSPFKKTENLADNNLRYKLVQLAIEDNENFSVSDIEFSLPQPSYTVNTLKELSKQHSDKQFVLLMGEDNIVGFHKWKDYEYILENYNIYVYPRNDVKEKNTLTHKNIHFVSAPLIDISATYIRKMLSEGKDIRYFLPDRVLEEIKKIDFYKKK